MLVALTDRQREVLDFAQSRIEAGARPPSLREIGRKLGMNIPCARQHLLAIEKKGYIRRGNGARAIEIVATQADIRSGSTSLPIVSRIAAGRPILSDDQIDERVEIGSQLFSPTPDFLVKVVGESMIDVGIRPGDLVGVRQQQIADHRQIVAASVLDRSTGEYGITLKRFFVDRDGRYILRSENQTLQIAPIEFAASHLVEERPPLIIAGIYCGHFHRGSGGSI